MYEIISGGVTAAQGFSAGATRCGIKASSQKDDTAIIFSEIPCTPAAVYTKNRVKASPIQVTRDHLANQVAQAVIVNSGNANACAPDGMENAQREAAACAKLLNIPENDVIVCSTGVIGQRINIECIEENLHTITLTPDGSDAAANAIMTTDTVKKELALACSIGGRTVTLGAIAKGSGMIHPNMGTMLCFVTTDCAITREMLSEALREVVPRTFNRVTVDGDTSTNDMCAVLANGMAGNPLIEWKDDGYTVFLKALRQLCQELARAIAGDGEGASRLITCAVREARSEESAERLAKAVVGSPLVKAAMFGADANWGRVLCAMGYSKAPFRPEYVDISFSSAVGAVAVCRGGMGLDFDEEAARSILSQDEVVIDVHLHEGEHEATCWGCDLTYEYVKINGDYRT